MKYKVIDYVSKIQEVEFGTCELCFHTGYAEEGYLVIEDELNRQEKINLSEWEWGDCTEIYIGNIIDFSSWLNQRDEPPFEEIDVIEEELNKIYSKTDDFIKHMEKKYLIVSVMIILVFLAVLTAYQIYSSFSM